MRTIHNTARIVTAGPDMKIFSPKELGITAPCSPECADCAMVVEWAEEPLHKDGIAREVTKVD